MKKFVVGRFYTTDDEGLDGIWECVWREQRHVTMRMGNLATTRVPVSAEWRNWSFVEVCRPLEDTDSDGPALRADIAR